MYSTIWTVCILALFDIGIFLLKNVLICVPLETFETNFSGLYMTACFFYRNKVRISVPLETYGPTSL